MDGYILQNEWPETYFELEVDPTELTGVPKPASFTDHPGTDRDSVTIPAMRGVEYVAWLLEGGNGSHDPVGTGTHLLKDLFALTGGNVILAVEARPAPGFRLPTGDGDEMFTDLGFFDNDSDVTPEPEPSEIVVDLPKITKTDIDGEPGYVLPQYSGGFTWYVNGQPVDDLVDAGKATFVPAPGGGMSVSATGGLYQITGSGLGMDIDTVTIGAHAEPGYMLTMAGEFGRQMYVADSRTPVELERVTVIDAPGTEGDAFIVPDATGLIYTDAAGNVLAPGEHPLTAEYVDGLAMVYLFASSAPGYRLEANGLSVEEPPGSHSPIELTITFTATAEVGDEETEDDGAGIGTGTGDGAGSDNSIGNGAGDGGGLDLDLVANPGSGDGAGSDATSGANGDPTAGEQAQASTDASADERLADTGPGGTAGLALMALALLMAGGTVAMARRTAA